MSMSLRVAISESSRVPAEWLREALGPSVGSLDLVVGDEGGAPGASLLAMLDRGDADAALLRGVSVRSLPEGVLPVAVLPREEPRDVLVAASGAATPLRDLSAGTRVGVTGARRRAFLRVHRSDLTVVSLENGTTPAQALEHGTADAIVLGALEARQTGLSIKAAEILDPKAWLPGPGQGTTVLVAREGAVPSIDLTHVNDADASDALTTEVALLDILGVPPGSSLGSLAQPTGRGIRLWAAAASEDGRALVRSDLTGSRDAPEALARAVATQLMERGLARVLSGVAVA